MPTRNQLLEKLSIVSPAIAAKPLIPIMGHYWFTGDHLLASDGQISIQVPFETDFKGAVPNTLLKYLKVLPTGLDNAVSFSSDGERLTITNDNNKSKFRLAMLGSNFPFTMPDKKQIRSVNLDPFLKAVKDCMISVGAESNIEHRTVEHLGITFEKDGDDLYMYSFDGGSIARARVPGDLIKLDKRAIVAAPFWKQVLALRAEMPEKAAHFEFGSRKVGKEEVEERYALFIIGDVRLYGRLLETRTPLNFKQLLLEHLPKDFLKTLVPVPADFVFALERAELACGDRSNQVVRVTVNKGKIVLFAKSDKAEAADEVIYEQKISIVFAVAPKWLLRGVEKFEKDKMTINPVGPCVIMTNKDRSFLYLISCANAA